MEKKIQKKIVVNLIIDDLQHEKLIGGLNLLGFKSDDSKLRISESVFSLMGLNTYDTRLDHLTDEYCDRAYVIHDFARNDSESFHRLAIEIYNWLSSERRKYIRLLEKG